MHWCKYRYTADLGLFLSFSFSLLRTTFLQRHIDDFIWFINALVGYERSRNSRVIIFASYCFYSLNFSSDNIYVSIIDNDCLQKLSHNSPDFFTYSISVYLLGLWTFGIMKRCFSFFRRDISEEFKADLDFFCISFLHYFFEGNLFVF